MSPLRPEAFTGAVGIRRLQVYRWGQSGRGGHDRTIGRLDVAQRAGNPRGRAKGWGSGPGLGQPGGQSSSATAISIVVCSQDGLAIGGVIGRNRIP